MPKQSLNLILVLILPFIFIKHSLALEPDKIFQMNKDAVGVIHTENKLGSGVVIGENTILTNCHVISGSQRIEFKLGNKSYNAILYEGNPALDLCKLAVPELKANIVKVRDISTIKIGERVYAIGNPLGYELTISDGLVSGLRDYEDNFLIQTSAPITHGSSGGGLFDSSGKLIGITSSGLEELGNINFAIPITFSRKLSHITFVEDFSNSSVRITPTFLDHIMDLCMSLDSENIITLSQAWLNQDKSSAYAWFLLGYGFELQDKFQDSKAAYLKSIEINKEFTPSLLSLYSLSSRLGGDGSNHLSGCVSAKNVGNSLLVAAQALCKAALKDDSGVAQLNSYLEQDQPRSWLFSTKAHIYLSLKNLDLAEKSALRAVEINQNNADAYGSLASIAYFKKDYQAGKTYVEKALSVSPKSPSLLELSLLMALLKGDKPEMESALRDLQSVSPQRVEQIKKKITSKHLNSAS